jgi:hypothetical protein
MKLHELIEKLKEFNPDAEVSVIAHCREYNFTLTWGVGCTKKDTDRMALYVDELCTNETQNPDEFNPWEEIKEPIHEWFELSYANYLTIPRTALQSMPVNWQERFVKCLEELDEKLDWRPETGRYFVTLRDDQGRYQHDPLCDYQRGRRKMELKN